MIADDIRYLWAAYRQGGLKGMPPNVEAKDLFPLFKQGIDIIKPGGGITTLLARNNGETIPVGWLIGWKYALTIGPAIDMEAVWAPWATPRNKLETLVTFLHRARALGLVIMWSCKHGDERLFEHVRRYGVARRVGSIMMPGDERIVFQSVEIR